jgi:NAD(P)-dependent dehydrogenase (short-subunit alcohol dehydrogenase family)
LREQARLPAFSVAWYQGALVQPVGTAVVTGASRGLGRSTALALAARGFDVVATLRDPSKGEGLAREASSGGLSLRLEKLDVTKLGSFTFPTETRVLVNNAGIRLRYLPAEGTPLDEWREVFETNLFGLVEVTRRAVHVLRGNGGGVICNIGSAAMLAPLPFYSTYVASKAAASAFSEVLRHEVRPFGIRVIEILPGPIETELLGSSSMMRMVEAADFPDYKPMAEKLFATRRQHVTTASNVAAEAIVDAILDDQGPLRYGCDPVSIVALDMWRSETDQDRLSRVDRRLQ